MRGLRTLCLSPGFSLPCGGSSSSSSSSRASGSINLSARPSVLTASSKSDPNIDDHLSLPLPELPAHVKEKILSLELMGVDSGRVLSLNPDLQSASPDSINSVISYLLSKGIHHKDLGRIFGMCPKILTSSIRSDLSPVFHFLSRDLHVAESNFRRVINKCPRLLVSSVRDQLRPALIYLLRLGFKDKEALAFHDTVLLVSSVENTLIPKLKFLMGLGLTREDAVGMVLRCPCLFTFSIENNFKPKFEYFTKEMDGTLDELKEFPQYFTFSLDKRIKPRHRELKEIGFRVGLPKMLKTTDEEFKDMIEKHRVLNL